MTHDELEGDSRFLGCGSTQRQVFRALKEHGKWRRHSGWVWDTQRNTEKVMESLVKRGLVRKETVEGCPYPYYYPNCWG